MSDTPRTDAVAKRYDANEIGAAEVLIHAGKLERENAALREALKFAAKAYDDEQSKFELVHRLYDVSCVARKVLARKEAQP